jgi:hypothetical protein
MSFGKSSLRSLAEAAQSTSNGRVILLTWTHVTAAEAALAASIASKAAMAKRIATLQRPSVRIRLKDGQTLEGAAVHSPV